MLKRLSLASVVVVLVAGSVYAVALPRETDLQTNEAVSVFGEGGLSESVGDVTAVGEAGDPGQAEPNDSATATGAVSGTLAVSVLAGGATAADGSVLQVSASPDRSEPVNLNGATVSGSVYVFAVVSGASRVDFWLDDTDLSGAPVQTERNAPYDLAGGNASLAQPLDLDDLGNGSHNVSIRIQQADGTRTVHSASFTVGVVPAPVAAAVPLLLVSDHPARIQPDQLGGDVLTGDAYVFLQLPGGVAKSVSFWLNSSSGSPFRIEQNAPFDLVGGTTETAKPLDTTKLGDGQHSVKAQAVLYDGSTVVTTATFKVSNSTASGSGGDGESTATTSAPNTTVAPQPTTTAAPSSGAVVKGDIRFKPGDNVKAIVANASSGTVFVFSPGVYKGVSIEPKGGQTFIGEAGAVLDGNGAKFAFRSGTGVTIKNLEITGYQPSSKEAVIAGGADWTLVGNEIHHNGEKGVQVNNGWTLTSNHIHHNGRYGIAGSGSGITISGNDISYNSTEYGASGDSGGTKFVKTTGLVLRNNSVHHNYGNGLWIDINNLNVLVEGNSLSSNQMAGVFIEISCGGTIRNNSVKDNGQSNPYPNWMAGSSGIQVANSPNVKIYGNTLSGNEKGIGATQVDHANLGAVTNCTPQLKNLDVYSNTITQSGGAAAGIDANNNQGNVWSSWGNKFRSNTYKLSSGAEFRWGGDWISHDEWKAKGLS